MNTLKQMVMMVSLGIRSLPQRLGGSSVVVIGVAGVVAVLVTVLAMADGLASTLKATGRGDRALVLSGGATSEEMSALTEDALQRISDAPGIKRTTDGKAAVSGEMLVSVNLRKISDRTEGAVSVRGVPREGFFVHTEIRLVAGRMFRPGLHEIIVGKSAKTQFLGLDIGSRVPLRDGDWTVVGIFETGGESHESELIADAPTLMSAYRRTYVNSVTVLMASQSMYEQFANAVSKNPALSVNVLRETQYYESQTEGVASFLYFVSHVVGAIMAIGALLGVVNTMFSAVSTRSAEIATLRAMGFGENSVVVAVLTEALALALLGSFLGALLAWLIFNGATMATVGGTTPVGGQIVYRLNIGYRVIVTGIVWASVVGLLGGLLPAIRAARLPVATVLRTQ